MSDESDAVNIDGGFVLVARAMLTSSLMSMSSDCLKVALALLLKARHKPYKWFDKYQNCDIVIEKGELTATFAQMAEITKLSRWVVKRSIGKLLGHGFIADITPDIVKQSNGYHHLRVCKYTRYQDMANYSVQRPLNDRSTTAQRLPNDRTLLKEDKQDKQYKSTKLKRKGASAKKQEATQEIQVVWDYYQHEIKDTLTFNAERKAKIKTRLKTFGVDQLFKAIDGAKTDDWHMGRDPKTEGKEKLKDINSLFMNDSRVENFIEMATKAKPAPQQPTTPVAEAVRLGKDAMRKREEDEARRKREAKEKEGAR